MREKLIELLRKTRHEYRQYIGMKDMEKRMAKTDEEFLTIDDSIAGEIPFCADYLIANGIMVQQWIPVTERLPEPYKQVITLRTYLLSGDSYPVGLEYVRLHGDANIPTWSGDYATWKNKVTHWMPLPALPKES